MIQGYTLTTFPKVVHYTYVKPRQYSQGTRTDKKNNSPSIVWEVAPCIIGVESLGNRFSTQQEEKLNKVKEGGNLQTSSKKKDNTRLCMIFLFYI